MSAFTAINLEKLAAPEIVNRSDFETVLGEVKAWLIAREPGLGPVLALESEPIVKVIEAWAYRETLLRAEVDDAGRGNMLAFAVGPQLDHLAAFFGVQRAIVQAADPDAVPPVPEILETDARLRQRTQLALEGFTTAGSRGAYVFWGLSASPLVKDIGILSPTPGRVDATVLSTSGDGVPDAALLTAVAAQLNHEDVRPLTDLVVVQPATIINYTIDASLIMYDGPDAAVVRQAAETAVRAYVSENHLLGHDITVSGLHAALHQPGVQNVNLTSPAANIVVSPTEAAFCTSVSVTFGGVDV
ncbi:baseplate J/gp47 family protein [Ruegeria marisrubri]|uniref:baseplate assembly protein n=1 Tax=Ruegeria marisrubri TaxID=1685379 RepID=UPI001CD33757|nr:baseplate J/gp47 family protein [Ruegeria marisrubri]MCA0905134.1 baseplate J/gp47 family protein [Ruegeria marisrubri]